MSIDDLKVSENFRKMAVRSVLSIILFLFTYIILIILGIGVIFLCGLAAYALVVLKFMVVTFMLGVGFLGMGFMIFYFLIKFIFSSAKKVDRSHLFEITEEQQPALFKLIHEIVDEVKTDFPKQVYLSSEVNASVFYDSNFWSMFFPVRKNLQIGIGLMNVVSAIEFKAVLAHEFGHFSQRSMKVGSYVYNMNRVIYNMLYDNESYGLLLQKWSNVSSYFILFSRGAVLVISGIQYLLAEVYKIVNLNYMALSREMEFHADAVAACVTGTAPLANSLLRLELADQSLSVVLNYYNDKISVSQKTGNFYPQQYFVLNHIAETENLPIEAGLPKLSVDFYTKLKKTRLVLDSQWSSHPATEERVARLINLNLPLKGKDGGVAIDLLANKEQLQEMFTAQIFENVKYQTDPVNIGSKDFIDEYLKQEEEKSYPPVYKSYFNFRNPYIGFTEEDFELAPVSSQISIEQIIDNEVIEQLSTMNTAISDKDILEQICNGKIEIKTFDYGGEKYSVADTYSLIRHLDNEIINLRKVLEAKDVEIFNFSLNKALTEGSIDEFKERAITYRSVSTLIDKQQEAYLALVSSAYFIHVTTPFAEITNNMFLLKNNEKSFKEQLRILLENDLYDGAIDAELRLKFREYVDSDWKYFEDNHYFDKEVDALFVVISEYYTLISEVHSTVKRALLNFNLEIKSTNSIV